MASDHRRAPLGALYAFTFLNSVGTAVMQNGIFFLLEKVYGSTRLGNFGLGLLLGATYIVGSFGAERVMRRLIATHPGLSPRVALVGIMAGMAALCQLPWAAKAAGFDSAWVMWVLIGLYSPLSGMLWPLVESYLSGGRSGGELRWAMGRWNMVWSAATTVTFWAMAAFMTTPELASMIVPMLGGVHVVAALMLAVFPAHPAGHVEGAHEPHPPVYASLLDTFRLLLPASYLVLSALAPYLPGAAKRVLAEVGWGEHWATVVVSTWMLARVGTFALMGYSERWHGRWAPAIQGGAMLVGGFALCVMAPVVASGYAGLAMLIAGLAVFGTGMATIYSAAIYYAMEVGKAEVQAGGTHEALIGVGYTIGPGLGFIAALAVHQRAVPESWLEPMLLSGVGLAAAAVCTIVALRVKRQS